MKSYLQECMVEIRTLAPVFIGSGMAVDKKEYIYDRNQNRVYFLNMRKLFEGLVRLRKLEAFESYMAGDDSSDLFFFFRNQGIDRREYQQWVERTVPVADVGLIGKSTKKIALFIKDPYGNPYIPGSSFKGMLRTILTNAAYLQHEDAGALIAEETEKAVSAVERGLIRVNRDRFLKDIDAKMDVQIFHRALFEETARKDQVNDMLRGMIVGDSVPLSPDDLCICQKIDLAQDGSRKPMPILRECLKPNLTIRIPLTLDRSVCTITKQQIYTANKQYYENYQNCFSKKFEGAGAPRVKGNSTTFFLGGGAGYVSKTASYSIFRSRKGPEIVGRIINQTVAQRERQKHNHMKDGLKGISPRLLKCTKYNGEFWQMGACCFTRIEERETQMGS